MKIRILCYKPEIDGHLLDNCIDMWTRLWNLKAPKQLRTSHSEVWLPEWGHPKARPFVHGQVCGSCYTSTMGRGNDGVCRRSASSVLRHPNRWNYFEIELDNRVYQHFINDMDEKVRDNLGYDKLTIASYFWYKRLGHPKKYICSEFTHLSILPYVADQGKLFHNLLKLHCPSPLRLAYALHRSGLDLYSLETGECILKGKV
jgi:hypothetical protein